MNVLYFGNFLDVADTRLQSVETKIWFKNTILTGQPFEWDSTTTITELTKLPYSGLVLDLSSLKHGARAFERQYITRLVLRQIDDRPRSFFLVMNDYTFDCLKKESIKDLTKIPNLFIRDVAKNGDVKCLQKFLGVSNERR